MDSYHRAQTLLEAWRNGLLRSLHESKGATIFARRRGWPFFRKSLAVALTVVPLGFSAEVFSQPIKLGYAAFSAGQVTAWMAKEGGYLSKYGIEAELIYIPAIAATQALIAGEIQLLK